MTVHAIVLPLLYVYSIMKKRIPGYIVMLCCTLCTLLSEVSCSRGKGVTPATKDSVITPKDSNVTTIAVTKTYLALGDSYTIGQSIDASGRYPTQAAQLVTAKGTFNIPDVHYIAVTGWTTANLQNAIAAQNLADTFDVVTLLIGVNDQYQGVDTGTYAIRFTQLLQTSVALARNNKAHVIVLSIPDYGVTPFGGGNASISAQIDIFNSINKRITSANGIAYLDVTTMSRAAANDATLLAPDGLHYSAKEYGMWAAPLSTMMQLALK